MKRRVTVRGIVLKDGKLLCVKLSGYRNGKPTDYWCVPGGGIDEKESLYAALEREMIEETGIKPQIGNLLYVQQYASEKEEQLEFFFHIKNTDDYQKINLAATTHGEIEIVELDFIDPQSSYILPTFLNEVSIRADIEDKPPTRVFNYL